MLTEGLNQSERGKIFDSGDKLGLDKIWTRTIFNLLVGAKCKIQLHVNNTACNFNWLEFQHLDIEINMDLKLCEALWHIRMFVPLSHCAFCCLCLFLGCWHCAFCHPSLGGDSALYWNTAHLTLHFASWSLSMCFLWGAHGSHFHCHWGHYVLWLDWALQHCAGSSADTAWCDISVTRVNPHWLFGTTLEVCRRYISALVLYCGVDTLVHLAVWKHLSCQS